MSGVERRPHSQVSKALPSQQGPQLRPLMTGEVLSATIYAQPSEYTQAASVL